MAQDEMVIFTRTFELLAWLMPVSNHFPKQYRHTYTQRLLTAAFDLNERLEEANLRVGRHRVACLRAADEALARVRIYIRLAVRLRWLSKGQYQHVAQLLNEIGRLLGGWLKASA